MLCQLEAQVLKPTSVGSCLLQLVLTDLSVDIAVDSRSTLGRYSGRQSVETRLIVSRAWDGLSAKYRSIFRRRTSTDYRSTVGCILVFCDWGTCGSVRRSCSYQKCHKTGCHCKERHAFMFNFEQFGLITDRKMSKNANLSRISTCQWVK